MTVGDAPRRIATFHPATLRVAPHRYATREPLGTPGGSRAFSADGHPQAPVAPRRSCAARTFFVAQSWAECITNMPGFNLRQAQHFPDHLLGCKLPSRSIRNFHLACREGDLVTRRRSVCDRRHVGECDRRRQRRAGAARNRVHDLARRQGPAMPQMVVHEVHRLEEVAVQRDIIRVVPWKLIETVEMVRIGDLVVVQRARRSVDYIVETKISTRGEIRRQDAVVASLHENRRNARELAGRKDLFDAFVDAIRLGLLQPGKGRPLDGVFAGRERTQAERAVEVLVWGRAAILFWSACRGVVDCEPHLDLLALTPRLLEALGACERPGNVSGVLVDVAWDLA